MKMKRKSVEIGGGRKYGKRENERACSTRIAHLFYLWLYLFFNPKPKFFLRESESSKMEAGKGEDQTGVEERRWEEAELQTGLSDCYGCRDWESMGEEMCRKQGAGAVTEEGGTAGLERPYDSR